MRVPPWLFLAAALASGWALACAGGAPPDPPQAPEPEPEPEPPRPAPNADRCARFQGVALPLDGGTITACTPTAVTIEHAGGDPAQLRWDYANRYIDQGWARAEPVNAAPAVVRDARTLVFRATDAAVIIRCTGCGGEGGRPDRGKRPRRP